MYIGFREDWSQTLWLIFEDAYVLLYLSGTWSRSAFCGFVFDTGKVYKSGAKKGQAKFRTELRYDGVRDLLDWAI